MELCVTKWVVLMENQEGGKEELIILNIRVKKFFQLTLLSEDILNL